MCGTIDHPMVHLFGRRVLTPLGKKEKKMASSSLLRLESSLDASMSSISLNASSWNRQKANHQVQGKPLFSSPPDSSSTTTSSRLPKDTSYHPLLRKRRYPTLPGLHSAGGGGGGGGGAAAAARHAEQFVKSKLDCAILRDCLSSHFLFQRLSEEDIEYLIQIFKPITYIQHEVIVQQGDAPGYFYILASGTVIITTTPPTASGKSQRSEDLTDKYVVFGELSLLTSTPQPATIKVTSSSSKLFRLDPTDFLKITRPQHGSGQETTTEQRFQLLRHAMPLDLVAPLEEDPIAMNKLVSGMSIYTFVQGDVLYEKGAMIHSFVAVAQGQVVVSQVSMGGRDYPDIYIGPNESETSFGWLTMEEDERLAGSIVAATDGIALVIPKHVFLHAVGGGNCGKTTLRQIVEQRSARIQLENVSLFQDSKLDLVQLNGLLDLMHHCQYEHGAIVVDRAEKVEPGMYFVREGSVTVEVKGQDTKTIEAGGYFGEKSMLLDQNKSGDKHYVKRSTMKVTARGPTTTRIDVLYLEECRKVLDTTRLGLGHSEKDDDSSLEDSDLARWSTLKRHALLGSGSFGQVWLATSTSSSSATLDNGEIGTAKQEHPLHPHTVALKIQFKYRLVQSPDHVERIIAERNILACLDSPFLLRLYSAFQDQHRLYMVTSLLQGGELESLIPEDGLSEESAKFYAAGILEGLTYMHRKHILHRDVKTTNVLINDKGYPVLIDMGFAKYVPEKTFTFCGSPMYTAPEIIRNNGHDKGCDHWSWAVLVYRMVTGRYPFYRNGMEELDLFKQICKGTFEVDGMLSMDFRVLMVSVLYPDPSKRLGAKVNGWWDIFASPWFSSLNLSSLRQQKMVAPWIPAPTSALDASRFRHGPDDDGDFSNCLPVLSNEQQYMFEKFGTDLSTISISSIE